MQSPENELKPWYYVQETKFGPYDIYDPNRGFNRWVCQANCKADADNIINAVNNEPDRTQIRKEVCEEILKQMPKFDDTCQPESDYDYGYQKGVDKFCAIVLRVRDKES